MENNTFLIEMLNFFNLADAEMMAGFPDAAGKAIGSEIAKNVIALRTKIGEPGFTELAQLGKVKGLEAAVKAAVKAMEDAQPPKGMVRSRTLFTFAGKPPVISGLERDIKFEVASQTICDEEGNPIQQGDETTYVLYYSEKLNKEQLFKALEANLYYRSSSLERVFAIQTRNNQFVTMSIPNYSVYLRSIYWASKFKITHSINNPHSPYSFPWNPTSKPNPYLAVAIQTSFYGNLGYLNFNSPQNRVAPRQITSNTPNPTIEEYFDISGIVGEPWAGAHPMFKNFTLMNTAQGNITGNDPREFIAADNALPSGGSNNGLVGSNNQTGWLREHQLRYVEVIENMSLESVQNMSHSGSARWFVNCVNSSTGEINAIQISAGAAIPDSAKFDMFVFYGYWDERSNISCRVAFRSKSSGQFVGLQPNSLGIQENINAKHLDLNEATSFYVENGWGGSVNNINLKTSFGKYLMCWQNVVVANTTSPINHEQFKVVTA